MKFTPVLAALNAFINKFQYFMLYVIDKYMCWTIKLWQLIKTCYTVTTVYNPKFNISNCSYRNQKCSCCHLLFLYAMIKWHFILSLSYQLSHIYFVKMELMSSTNSVLNKANTMINYCNMPILNEESNFILKQIKS